MKDRIYGSSHRKGLLAVLIASSMMAGGIGQIYAESAGVSSVTQSVSVQGTVLDPDGFPVIGASILEKGTTNGVITDIDGNPIRSKKKKKENVYYILHTIWKKLKIYVIE